MQPVPDSDFKLSIIVPAYNEADSLRRNIKCALEMNSRLVLEVIIILSPYAGPETRKACQELSEFNPKVSYYIQKKNPGLGYALREGFALAKGNYVQILYADCESDPRAIADFIQKAAETGADMVVASRWLKRGSFHDYPRIRYFFNLAYQRIFRALFRTRLHDLTFGYNLMRADILREIVLRGKRHEIATEMLLKALKMNYRIEEIPVVWRRRDEGKSKLNVVSYLCYPLMALYIFLCPRKYFSAAKQHNYACKDS